MQIQLLQRPLLPTELLDHPRLDELMPWRLATPTTLARRAESILAAPPRMKKVAAVLTAYNQSIDNDESALANCRQLAHGALSVVTGQQAGLLSGPLYTIYKIATTIRLARQAGRQLGLPVVPIYWNATEDHDLSEVASFHHPGREWRAEFAHAGVAAEALSVDPAVTQLLATYLQQVPYTAHHDEIAALTAPAFDNYGLYSSAVIARLFRGSGLIILEPRLLRPLAVSFLQQVVSERGAIRQALTVGAQRLAPFDVQPAFDANSGFGLFHLDEAGHRGNVLERHGQLNLHNRWLEADDVIREIGEKPDSFSTGAFLRPILQTQQLPTLAYVAGPSEYRYHLQLQPLFDLFGTEMPIIHPRNHATILTDREAKLADKLHLTPDDYFRGPRPLYWRRNLPEHDRQAFDRAEEALSRLFDDLRRELQSPVHDRRFESYGHSFKVQLQSLRKKTHRDYLSAAGIGNDRLDRFFAVVLPRNTLQERVLNIFHFIESQGADFPLRLVESFDPMEPRHYLITTSQ